MKKFLFVLVSLVISLSSFAQWKKTFIPGDELKGTQECTAYFYTNESVGTFVYWSCDTTTFSIQSNKHIFNYHGRTKSVKIKIGIYNNTNKLIEMFELESAVKCRASDGKGNVIDITTPVNLGDIDTDFDGLIKNEKGYTKRAISTVLNHIKNDTGYVRFLAPLYGGVDFDLKVPCKNN